MSSYVVGLFGVFFRGCSGSVYLPWVSFCYAYLLSLLSFFLLVVVLAVVLVAGGVVAAMAMVVGVSCLGCCAGVGVFVLVVLVSGWVLPW